MPLTLPKNIKYRNILVPDGESHMLLYVVQCLRRNRNNKIHIISSTERLAMRYSRFLSSFKYFPNTDDDAQWIQQINKEVADKEIDVILPIFETGIRRLILNRDKLSKPERLCLLPELSSFDTAIDKWRLYKHLKEKGFPSPETRLFRSIEEETELNDFPLIIKPSCGYGGGMEIELLESKQDLIAYFRDKQLNGHTYILQEPIEGRDFSCSVLCRNGQILAYTIQRSDMGVEGRFGPQMAYSFVTNEQIHILVYDLMKSLGWSGVASVDIRYDEESDAYKILEVNTRFWRSVVGSLYAGINFPDLCVSHSLIKDLTNISEYSSIKYYDLKGIVRAIKQRPWLILNLGLLVNHSPLKEIAADPLPYLIKYIQRTKNLLFR